MNTEKVEQLLAKFEEGRTTLDEESMLRDFFSSGDVPGHLKSYKVLFQYQKEMLGAGMPEQTDPFAKIDFEDSEAGSEANIEHVNSFSRSMVWTLRVAAGFILLLAGFSAGLLVSQNGKVSGKEMAALRQEVEKMKSALVYGSFGPTSASERISAINMSSRLPGNLKEPDREISEILIYTMNNDDNVNVRQAAAEALFRFRNDHDIRRALVYSLSRQTDPLMQITLIDMLVKIREKGAVNEMQRLLMDADTRDVVKTQLEAGIAELEV